ncbi:MAG: lipopolysaccharide biosynthesis protein [Colwellia sp.]
MIKLKNKFHVDIFKMFSGGLLTQILGVISLPIMARLYAPELYGEYSIYLQMIVAISIVLSFRYEHLLLLSSTHEAAINNLKTITMISCIGIIVLPIVMIANFEFLEEQYGITLNTKIIMLLVLSGFFTILSHGLALNLQKNGVFFRSTLGDSIAKALSLLCGVLFAYSTFKEYGLLLALVLGLLCKVIYLVWISKFDIFKGQFTFDFKELRTFSKRSFSLVYSHILSLYQP